MNTFLQFQIGPKSRMEASAGKAEANIHVTYTRVQIVTMDPPTTISLLVHGTAEEQYRVVDALYVALVPERQRLYDAAVAESRAAERDGEKADPELEAIADALHPEVCGFVHTAPRADWTCRTLAAKVREVRP